MHNYNYAKQYLKMMCIFRRPWPFPGCKKNYRLKDISWRHLLRHLPSTRLPVFKCNTTWKNIKSNISLKYTREY